MKNAEKEYSIESFNPKQIRQMYNSVKSQPTHPLNLQKQNLCGKSLTK